MNKKTKNKRQIGGFLLTAMICSSLLGGCAVLDREESSDNTFQETDSAETLLTIDDPEEKAAVEAAKAKVAAMEENPRIIATSPAVAEICDRLDLELAGVCSSTVSSIPEGMMI